MAAVTAAGTMAGEAFAAFLSPSPEAALTADLIAGVLSGLGSAWQGLFPGIRVFGRLTAVGQYQQFAQAGTPIPYAAAVMPVGPGFPQPYTVASLAAALLAMPAQYGSGPLYTYTPAGWAAVTSVRTSINGVDGSPYAVELEANPIPGGLTVDLA